MLVNKRALPKRPFATTYVRTQVRRNRLVKNQFYQTTPADNPFKEILFFDSRDIPYLKLLCILTQDPTWRLQLHQNGHLDNCIAIAETLLSQNVALSKGHNYLLHLLRISSLSLMLRGTKHTRCLTQSGRIHGGHLFCEPGNTYLTQRKTGLRFRMRATSTIFHLSSHMQGNNPTMAMSP